VLLRADPLAEVTVAAAYRAREDVADLLACRHGDARGDPRLHRDDARVPS
jgi:hypothetical protein